MCFLNTSALLGCDTQYICTCVLLLEHQTSVLIKHTVACSRWTRTHTRTKKNNEIPPELSHTATTLGELEKNSSLSFSVVPHSVSNLSHLSDNLSLSHYPLIFPPQLTAGCDVCVCVCLVETALLDKGPQGSFVKIVKHCVGLVAGDRAGVREKQGNAFRYN